MKSKSMERRNRTYSFVLAAAFAAMFAVLGCGDEHLVSESDLPNLEQHIFVLPDRFTGQPYTFSTPVNTVYLDTNENVKFWAVYSLDGAYISSDTADDHYLNHSWTIEGEEYNISPLRFSFKTPGFRQGVLQTVDLLGDTLRDTLNIFVNTPIGISLIAPVNGFNQAKPISDNDVEIRWSLGGLDPWEESTCYVYASYNKDDVWKHNLGSVNCLETARFVGTFIGDSLMNYLDENPDKDTSVTIYWSMRAIFRTLDGFEETDSTEIFHFSTLFLHEDSSVITIPIKYEDHRKGVASALVVITNNIGDTIFTQHEKTSIATIKAKVAPQTGLNIYVSELARTEFQAEPVVVNVSPGAQTIIDTVRLQDRTQPQVSPREIADLSYGGSYGAFIGDSVYFYALDNGTGINPNKIVVTADSDTLSHVYDEPFIKFRHSLKDTCKIRIYVEDFARNASPSIYWKYIPDKNHPSFSGPYSELGGDL